VGATLQLNLVLLEHPYQLDTVPYEENTDLHELNTVPYQANKDLHQLHTVHCQQNTD